MASSGALAMPASCPWCQLDLPTSWEPPPCSENLPIAPSHPHPHCTPVPCCLAAWPPGLKRVAALQRILATAVARRSSTQPPRAFCCRPRRPHALLCLCARRLNFAQGEDRGGRAAPPPPPIGPRHRSRPAPPTPHPLSPLLPSTTHPSPSISTPQLHPPPPLEPLVIPPLSPPAGPRARPYLGPLTVW